MKNWFTDFSQCSTYNFSFLFSPPILFWSADVFVASLFVSESSPPPFRPNHIFSLCSISGPRFANVMCTAGKRTRARDLFFSSPTFDLLRSRWKLILARKSRKLLLRKVGHTRRQKCNCLVKDYYYCYRCLKFLCMCFFFHFYFFVTTICSGGEENTYKFLVPVCKSTIIVDIILQYKSSAEKKKQSAYHSMASVKSDLAKLLTNSFYFAPFAPSLSPYGIRKCLRSDIKGNFFVANLFRLVSRHRWNRSCTFHHFLWGTVWCIKCRLCRLHTLGVRSLGEWKWPPDILKHVQKWGRKMWTATESAEVGKFYRLRPLSLATYCSVFFFTRSFESNRTIFLKMRKKLRLLQIHVVHGHYLRIRQLLSYDSEIVGKSNFRICVGRCRAKILYVTWCRKRDPVFDDEICTFQIRSVMLKSPCFFRNVRAFSSIY